MKVNDWRYSFRMRRAVESAHVIEQLEFWLVHEASSDLIVTGCGIFFELH